MTAPAPPRLSLARRLGFSGLALCLGLALLEVLARLLAPPPCGLPERLSQYLQAVGSSQPQTVEESLRRSMPMPYDPWLIWHLVPHFRGQNLGTEVIHNSRGLRSPELPLAKPAGTTRLLMLGDSTIYGHGVAEGETLRARLEEHLRRGLSPRLDVINGGVPGYSSLQSLNQLKGLTLRYQPDVVLLANMWSDCVYDRFQDEAFIYGLGGQARWKHAQQNLEAFLAEHSALYCLLRRISWQVTAPACAGRPPLCGPEPAKMEARARATSPAATEVQQPGRGAAGSRPRVPVERYGQNLIALAEVAENAGAKVLFVALPNQADVGEPATGPTRLEGFDAYRQRMRSVAQARKAPLVELGPAFAQAQARGARGLFLDFVHPSAAGHALMAETISQAILADPAARSRLAGPSAASPGGGR